MIEKVLLPRSQELDKMKEGLQKENLAMQLFLIVALGLAVLTVIFALQNPIPVSVAFFGWGFEGSLALVLLLTFTLGVDLDSCHTKKKIGGFNSDKKDRGAGE